MREKKLITEITMWCKIIDSCSEELGKYLIELSSTEDFTMGDKWICRLDVCGINQFIDEIINGTKEKNYIDAYKHNRLYNTGMSLEEKANVKFNIAYVPIKNSP